MEREFTRAQEVRRSITTEFSHSLVTPFFEAVKKYGLIRKGDRIAVCLSGGKDSALLALLMEQYARITGGIEIEYISMNPGYSDENLHRLRENCEMLEIPVRIFTTDVLSAAEAAKGKSPCWVCAHKRRGWLYKTAQDLGCGKIALGHHFDDVIETTLMGMLFGAQIQGMLPRLKSNHFEGIELIRPMYMIEERNIIRWAESNGLEFLRCACRFSSAEGTSKRAYVKKLIAQLEGDDPKIRKNIFNSIHTADCDTLVGYKIGGVKHSFSERFD